MRTDREIWLEIERLRKLMRMPRLSQYRMVAFHARAEQLLWALGEPSGFDEEER